MEDTMSIGQRIRTLREQKDLSQGDISRQTGMLRSYISRVEHGHTSPSLETLQRFAWALGVPMYWLFYDAGNAELPVALGGRPTGTTLEVLAQSPGTKGSDARLPLQLKGMMGNIMESDRALLLECARKLANRVVVHRQ
jgi:transcriptional regulator with XRE-family HTH domain